MTRAITLALNGITIALTRKEYDHLKEINAKRNPGSMTGLNTLLRELGEYIDHMRHRIDGKGQEVMFDEAMGVMFRYIGQGVWVVVDIWLTLRDNPRPVFSWQRVMRSGRELLMKIVSYWIWDKQIIMEDISCQI